MAARSRAVHAKSSAREPNWRRRNSKWRKATSCSRTDTTASAAFPSGAHVCEVEIDPATGVLELIRYVAVDDAGKIYNHTIVEGQVVGGLVQGIGQVMGEHCVYEPETGQLLTGTF